LGAWYRLPPSCALLGGFAIGARVALLWQHNANPIYKLASIPRYDDIVRMAGWTGSACVAGRRATGGVLDIAAVVWTAGFHWWRSGNKKRTQNVSEYTLVLALCLVCRLFSHMTEIVLVIVHTHRKCTIGNCSFYLRCYCIVILQYLLCFFLPSCSKMFAKR